MNEYKKMGTALITHLSIYNSLGRTLESTIRSYIFIILNIIRQIYELKNK